MFSTDVHDAFRAHAIADFPNEACGLVIERDGAVSYLPCRNASVTPDKTFVLHPSDYVEAFETGNILALLHSHVPNEDWPNGCPHPSPSDMKLQMDMDLVFGIAVAAEGECGVPFYFGDGAPIQPLIGRQFLWGVTDCYALIRDYYRTEFGITLRNIPRAFEWWTKGETLFMDNFMDAGFRPIDLSEIKKGDCCLMRIFSKTPNHAGVYLGDGLMMHHGEGMLSAREPVGNYHYLYHSWLRHKDLEA